MTPSRIKQCLWHYHHRDSSTVEEAINPGPICLPNNAYVWTGMMTLTPTVLTLTANLSIYATDVQLTQEFWIIVTRPCSALTEEKGLSARLCLASQGASFKL